MSKENVQKFLEEAVSTPELAKKLEGLEQSCIEKLITLAQEAGFEISAEDFTEAAQALSDEEVEAAAGGGRDGGMEPIQLLSGTGYEFVKEHFPQYLDRCFPK